jgi:hypothetical protein
MRTVRIISRRGGLPPSYTTSWDTIRMPTKEKLLSDLEVSKNWIWLCQLRQRRHRK